MSSCRSVCGHAAKAERNEAVHGHLQTLIELAVDPLDAENPRDFPACERNRLGEIVPEGQYSQRDEDIQILLGGQSQFAVALHLPSHIDLRAVGQHFGSRDVDFADVLPHTPLENRKRYGGEVLLLDGEMKKRRLGHWLVHGTKPGLLVFTLKTPVTPDIYDEAHGVGAVLRSGT